MDYIYRGAMRLGPRLLFWLAVCLFISGAAQSFMLEPRNFHSGSRLYDWWQTINHFVSGISQSAVWLLAALILNRIDLWLARTPPTNSN